jgi:ATP/maltotriose-dependent transcriptional regulator MalT
MEVREAIARCSEIIDRGVQHRQSEAMVRCSLSLLHAMQGDFDRARDLYRTARPMLEDYGAVVLAAWTSLTSARVELLAGNIDAAQSELQRDHDKLLELGELFFRPLVAALLAQTLCAQGRFDEAFGLAEEAAEIAADDDLEAQAILRAVKAKVLVHRARVADATQLAREAIDLLATTDDVVARSEILLDLAEVECAAGNEELSADALRRALDLCRRKQMTVQTERVEAMLDALRSESVPQQA